MLGVLIGTTITRIITNVWYDPYILYKYGFKKSPLKYYVIWFKYFLFSVLNIFIMLFIYRLFMQVNFINTIIMMIICFIIFISLITIFFHKTDEYEYFINLIKKGFRKERPK